MQINTFMQKSMTVQAKDNFYIEKCKQYFLWRKRWQGNKQYYIHAETVHITMQINTFIEKSVTAHCKSIRLCRNAWQSRQHIFSCRNILYDSTMKNIPPPQKRLILQCRSILLRRSVWQYKQSLLSCWTIAFYCLFVCLTHTLRKH